MAEFDAVLGYGSLMNAATHDYGRLGPVRVAGWRRVWRSVAGRPAAILSVEPGPGMLAATARVPRGAWPALDAREAAYERHDASAAVDPPGGRVALYVVPEGPTAGAPPIRLSYLDVVIQGALALHGPAGATDVFDGTGGWGVVIDDRAAPLYPRAQRLREEERVVVDGGLARLGVPVQAS